MPAPSPAVTSHNNDPKIAFQFKNRLPTEFTQPAFKTDRRFNLDLKGILLTRWLQETKWYQKHQKTFLKQKPLYKNKARK